MQSDNSEPSIDKLSSSHIYNPPHYHHNRGHSCSPTRQEQRVDTRNVFSTVRRTRSPYRKQSLDMQSNNGSSASRRPPLPRKFKNTVGILDHDNENNQQCLDVSSPYYHNNLFATSTGEPLLIFKFINKQKLSCCL